MKKLLILLLFPFMALAQDNATVRRPYGQHTVSFTATPTFDAGISDSFKMTLTGNVTSSTLIGAEAGHQLTFELCQDGTGSRTFAWPAQMAGATAITSTAGVCTTEIFEYDGATASNPTTATGGGGGSGTVNSGTAGHYTYYASSSTTVSSNANLDDGVTAPNTLTYAGSAGIAALQYQATGTGAMTHIGTEGTCSGAASGKSVLCLGDATSHSAEISLNGGSFFPLPQWNSTSPVVGGIVVAGPFPQHLAMPRGTQGQPFIEGPGAGNPGFGQLDLSLATNVINRLVKANQTVSTVYNDQVNTFTTAGTADLSASTVASAFRVPNGAGLTTAVNGAIGYDTTSNNIHSGVNGADHLVAVWAGSLPANNDCIKGTVVSSHVELASAGTGACGSGGTPRLDQILSATNAWTTTNADNPLILQFAATTAGRTAVELTESAAGTSTGTSFLFNVHTLAASTLNPCQFTARGTVNGIKCDAATGSLSALGSANINSTQINGVTVTGTPAVGQIPIATSSSASSWGDPIVSYNYVSFWTAQDITVTRTSSVVRVSTFGQYGALLITFAGITGSPSGCTIQIKSADSAGNLQNNGSAVSVSPANGSTSQIFSPAATLATASQMQAVFACSVYPSAGTLTLDFAPSITTYVPNTVAHNLTQLAGTAVDVNSGTKSAGTQRVVLATDQPNLTTPLNVALAANQSTNVAQLAGTTTDTNSGNKSAGTLRVVLATDQPALTNKLLVTPDSVALPANQSVNVAQVAGTATDTNSGNKSAGTVRVVLATDQPALTNKLLVTPDSVALPANQSVNESQINGVTPLMGNGASGTGAQRVAIASDNTPFESIPVATATTTDATSTCYATSAASTNSTNCKASAGNIYGIYVLNTTTTNYFLRMYNSSSAPTCSSATGFIETIPALGASANGGGISRMQMAQGYGTGIGFCLTGGGSSTDNTNAATGVYVTILYK